MPTIPSSGLAFGKPLMSSVMCKKEKPEMKSLRKMKGELEIGLILGIAAFAAWITHVIT